MVRPVREDTAPWYKQFWPWALMSLPATAVVAGLYTYSLAASTSSGLVEDDYYNVGKAINRSLERGQKAQAMGLSANLAFSDGAVRLLLNNVGVQDQQGLTLKLLHATLPDRDQKLVLGNTGHGIWSGKLDKPLPAGKWYVQLMPMDESWRLEGELPTNAETTLELRPAL